MAQFVDWSRYPLGSLLQLFTFFVDHARRRYGNADRSVEVMGYPCDGKTEGFQFGRFLQVAGQLLAFGLALSNLGHIREAGHHADQAAINVKTGEHQPAHDALLPLARVCHQFGLGTLMVLQSGQYRHSPRRNSLIAKKKARVASLHLWQLVAQNLAKCSVDMRDPDTRVIGVHHHDAKWGHVQGSALGLQFSNGLCQRGGVLLQLPT